LIRKNSPLGWRISFPAMVVILLLSPRIFAQATQPTHKECTPTEAKQARTEAEQLKDWKSIYHSYKQFSQCDNGDIAEEYSDSVTHQLADNWKNLDALLEITASDKEFEDFVVRHIDETMTEEEASRVISNARQHCPPKAAWLCKSITDE
jgi:hypothetical protein